MTPQTSPWLRIAEGRTTPVVSGCEELVKPEIQIGNNMQIGMIGLGRMGANMVQRLLADDHSCVVYARTKSTRDEMAALGAEAADSVENLAERLQAPRQSGSWCRIRSLTMSLSSLRAC